MRPMRIRIPVARRPHRHRERLVAVGRRSQQVLLLAGATGASGSTDLDWTLADAIRAIDDAATDRIAVCDHGTFVRMITSADLVELDEVLDRTSRPPGGEW